VTTIRVTSALNGKYFRGETETLLATSLVQDNTLSFTARGLLYRIIVGPEEGPVTLEWLGTFPGDGLQEALAELEARGYVEVTR
jgi:hypothetical protein